jgi:ubiquinone/menaquinone biosynthesis C-methylase UbiE
MDDFDLGTYLKSAAALHLEDRFQEAHNIYRAILLREPNNVHVLHLLGVLLIQNGLVLEGKELVEKAISLCDSYPEAVANLKAFGCSTESKYQMDIEFNATARTGWPSFEEGTTDRWRHQAMVDFAGCFAHDTEKWLTIGDAYGHDSIMLRRAGIKNVVASDLDSAMLSLGHQTGMVLEYLSVNAEKINCPDNSFDYILCKEALHHMPRPILAIYEMLRVARKGVIFIEPHDPLIDWPAKKDHGFWRNIDGNRVNFGRCGNDETIVSSRIDWCESGAFNYVYTLSKREIHKICLGMGLPSYATKCASDFFDKDWASQPATSDSEGFRKTLEQIQFHTQVSSTVGKSYAYITGMLFKQSPSPEQVKMLRDKGYEFSYTPTRFIPLSWPNLA